MPKKIMTEVKKDAEATLDPEESKQEQEALVEAKEDDIREKIIKELNLDEDENPDLINSLVERELAYKKSLSSTIKQKIKWRDKANKPQDDSKIAEPSNEPTDVEYKIREQFEQRDLEELDFPEELKPEIKKLAQLKNISVKKASQDPYFLYQKQELESATKVDDASISRTGKGASVSLDPNKPPKFDMSTEEGRQQAAEWRKALEQSR